MIDCISLIFSACWDFFTEVPVPGLGMSFAVVYIGVALIFLGFCFIHYLLR